MAQNIKKSFLQKLASSPLWPAILSALVAPGIGQIYNRNYKRGILLLVVFIGGMFWFMTILTELLSTVFQGNPDTWRQDPVLFQETVMKVVQANLNMFITFYVLMILTWGFGVIDAYLTAKHPKPNPPSPTHEDADPID